jgi:hypothetical protein
VNGRWQPELIAVPYDYQQAAAQARTNGRPERSLSVHARILPFPFSGMLAGGHLDALRQECHGNRTDLLMDYHELCYTAPPTLLEQDGKPCEQVQGELIPRRVRFTSIQITEGAALCDQLDRLPPDHPARELRASLQFRGMDGVNYYIVSVRGAENPDLVLTARQCLAEPRSGPGRAVAYIRNWSPPPPGAARLIPYPKSLYQRFGGDPIEIHLDRRLYLRRLFVGGADSQNELRPAEIDVVLNVGDEASRWAEKAPPHPADQWISTGEGSLGMDAAVLAERANWVIERLQAGQRVLVHCSAGMNRSSSICCAALIVAEGLSAEAALERVRQHHPWARPDNRHWLALRWLARTASEQ